MPTWPDLDATLDYDAGWRQRFFEADRLGRCRPVARPVFHRVAEAVFGADGALARLASGRAVAVYLQADGIGVVLARADRAVAADPTLRAGADLTERADEEGNGGPILATVLTPGSFRPVTAADLWAALAAGPGRVLEPDPQAWPTATPCA